MAVEDSSLGPTVGFWHPVKEQCQPARIATALLIDDGKSSRLFMAYFYAPPALPVDYERLKQRRRHAGY
jgi:hypothetical protein